MVHFKRKTVRTRAPGSLLWCCIYLKWQWTSTHDTLTNWLFKQDLNNDNTRRHSNMEWRNLMWLWSHMRWEPHSTGDYWERNNYYFLRMKLCNWWVNKKMASSKIINTKARPSGLNRLCLSVYAYLWTCDNNKEKRDKLQVSNVDLGRGFRE